MKNNNVESFELRSSLAYLVQNNAITSSQGHQLDEIKDQSLVIIIYIYIHVYCFNK